MNTCAIPNTYTRYTSLYFFVINVGPGINPSKYSATIILCIPKLYKLNMPSILLIIFSSSIFTHYSPPTRIPYTQNFFLYLGEGAGFVFDLVFDLVPDLFRVIELGLFRNLNQVLLEISLQVVQK
jgi:hypothetical protein